MYNTNVATRIKITNYLFLICTCKNIQTNQNKIKRSLLSFLRKCRNVVNTSLHCSCIVVVNHVVAVDRSTQSKIMNAQYIKSKVFTVSFQHTLVLVKTSFDRIEFYKTKHMNKTRTTENKLVHLPNNLCFISSYRENKQHSRSI